MTVDEVVEWLESAKRQHATSGQDIGNYEVMIRGREMSVGGQNHVESSSIDLRVDNGRNVVYIVREP
jgi:hypothetical protein